MTIIFPPHSTYLAVTSILSPSQIPQNSTSQSYSICLITLFKKKTRHKGSHTPQPDSFFLQPRFFSKTCIFPNWQTKQIIHSSILPTTQFIFVTQYSKTNNSHDQRAGSVLLRPNLLSRRCLVLEADGACARGAEYGRSAEEGCVPPDYEKGQGWEE